MAALTLSQMASRALRNAQIPEDSTSSSVLAIADAKQYINEKAKDIWARRVWREYLIQGSYAVPASTRRIALASITVATGYTTSGSGYNAAFAEVSQVYNENGDALLPFDPMSTNAIQPDLWQDTDTPTRYVNRGVNGIELLGEFDETTTLYFIGKANFQDLTDSESWVFGVAGEQALICGGTAELLRWHDRDDVRAQLAIAECEAWILKMIDAQEVQGANEKHVIPADPWTGNFPNGQFTTSQTGINALY